MRLAQRQQFYTYTDSLERISEGSVVKWIGYETDMQECDKCGDDHANAMLRGQEKLMPRTFGRGFGTGRSPNLHAGVQVGLLAAKRSATLIVVYQYC